MPKNSSKISKTEIKTEHDFLKKLTNTKTIYNNGIKIFDKNVLALRKDGEQDKEEIKYENQSRIHRDKNSLFNNFNKNKNISTFNKDGILINFDNINSKYNKNLDSDELYSSDKSAIEIFDNSFDLDEESITERVENIKNEKILEESKINSSRNNSKYESSIVEHLLKEKDFYDKKNKNIYNINIIKSDRTYNFSSRNSPNLNSKTEKPESISKPKIYLKSKSTFNNQAINEEKSCSEATENGRKIHKSKNESFSRSKRSTKITKNNEYTPYIQTDEEKRGLNKLKNELKNNLFLNFPKIEEDEKIKKKVKRDEMRKIHKIKKVYDSLSDEEFDIVNNIYRIDPFSKTKYFLDFLIFVVVIYSVSFSPLRLIFSHYKSFSLCLIEMLFDLLMIVDLLCGFVTGYYDFEENYIVRRQAMIKNYLKTYFTLDLFSGIPFNTLIEFYIYFFLQTKNDYYIYSEDKKLGLNIINMFLDYDNHKLFMLLKVLRIAKFIKIISNNAFIDKFKNRIKFTTTFSSAVNRMVFFLVYFLIISHILSCIYIFLGSLAIPSWINNIQMQNDYFSEIYLASLYFNHATIFTIGYGDVLSKNIYERIYNVLLMVVGIMIYSFAVTSLSNIIQQRDENTKNYQKNMEYLRELKIKYKFKKPLYDKIARYLKYDKNSNKKDKNDLLKELPISLRNDMILCMYDDIIKSFLFFKNFTNIEFIIKAIMCFKPVRSLKREVLVKETDFVDEMIFVKKGILSLECAILIKENNQNNSDDKVKITREKDQSLRIIEIRKNEHFGDVLIFLNERSPLTVRTKTKYSELYLMKKMDLVQLTTEFPDIFEQIYIKSSYNMYQMKKCIKKTKNLYYSKISNENKKLKIIQNINNDLDFDNKDPITIDDDDSNFDNNQDEECIDPAINNRQFSIEIALDEKNNKINNESNLTNKLLRAYTQKSKSPKNTEFVEIVNPKLFSAKELNKFKSLEKNNTIKENNIQNISTQYYNNPNKDNYPLDETNKNKNLGKKTSNKYFNTSNYMLDDNYNKNSSNNEILDINWEMFANEEMKMKKNNVAFINPFVQNSNGNDKTQFSVDVNSDNNIIDLYDDNINNNKVCIKESENIKNKDKINYNIKESFLPNAHSSLINIPIFYNFNINNNYEIKNNQNTYVKDIPNKEVLPKNKYNINAIEKSNKKELMEIVGDRELNNNLYDNNERTQKLDSSKTLSYLNLTNTFPIIEDRIIENVSSFTIENKNKYKIRTKSFKNKDNLCRDCHEKINNINRNETTKIPKKANSNKKILTSNNVDNEENSPILISPENQVQNIVSSIEKSVCNSENINMRKIAEKPFKTRKSHFYANAESFKQSVIMANTSNPKELISKCISNLQATNTVLFDKEGKEDDKKLHNLKNKLVNDNIDKDNNYVYNVRRNSLSENVNQNILLNNEKLGKGKNNLLNSNYNNTDDKKYIRNSVVYLNKNKEKKIMKEIQDIKKTSINFINPENLYPDLVSNILTRKKIVNDKLKTDEHSRSIKRLDAIIKKLNIK